MRGDRRQAAGRQEATPPLSRPPGRRPWEDGRMGDALPRLPTPRRRDQSIWSQGLGAARCCNRLEFDVLQFCNCFPPNLLTSAISQFVFKSSNLISSFLIFYTLYPPLFLFYPFLTIQDLHILFLNQKIFPSPVFFFYNLSCWREDEVVQFQYKLSIFCLSGVVKEIRLPQHLIYSHFLLSIIHSTFCILACLNPAFSAIKILIKKNQ